MNTSTSSDKNGFAHLSKFQVKQLQDEIVKSQSYQLAYEDTEFLASDDLALFHLVDTAEQAVEIMVDFYHGKPPK